MTEGYTAGSHFGVQNSELFLRVLIGVGVSVNLGVPTNSKFLFLEYVNLMSEDPSLCIQEILIAELELPNLVLK